tara:strand:- start:145 stop:642 length:498 start_codon:yes stop_codon:yes gene_type:complete
MRRVFGKQICDLAEKDKKIILIVGDIGFRVFDEFRDRFKDRFFNLGICEQSIIGVASGLALQGFKPWVYTITPFLIERPFEQIKLDVDQQNINIKLVGFSDYPTLGPTHTELNGKKLMNLFKNINSYFPKNGLETKQYIKLMYRSKRPCFLSLKTDPLQNKRLTS